MTNQDFNELRKRIDEAKPGTPPAQCGREAAAKRIRDDLYSSRITIRSMLFEDRKLAEEHGVITGRDISFAFWDGSYPPPAEIRCHKHKHEQLGPNTERVAGCMLLEGAWGRVWV